MFYGATSFNGDISNWNVEAVTSMSYMFNGATSFNGDISNWNVEGGDETWVTHVQGRDELQRRHLELERRGGDGHA